MTGETGSGAGRGVRVDNDGRLETTFAGTLLTAFGQLAVANDGNRADIEFIYDKQPELVDELTSGSGSATHNANARDVVLAVGDVDANDLAALYSYDVPYTPGNGQKIEITGTLDAAGLGTGAAFLFFRSNVTGSVVETAVAQSAWSLNTVSNQDWSKSFIFAPDFQSLKVGTIRFAMVRGGQAVPIHQIDNDNVRATGYWQLPSLPFFWRIYNDATYTYSEMGYGDTSNAIGIRYRMPVNASATMRAICATVKSQGGAGLFDIPGYQRSIDNGTTVKTVSTSLVPVLSIRSAATLNSIANRGLCIPTGYSIAANNPLRYVVLYRPSLTGASWTAVNATYSAVEYDVSASAVSGGIVIDSDYFSTGRNSASKDGGLLGRTLLRLTRTGTSDILTIAAIRTSSSDADTLAALKWKELR